MGDICKQHGVDTQGFKEIEMNIGSTLGRNLSHMTIIIDLYMMGWVNTCMTIALDARWAAKETQLTNWLERDKDPCPPALQPLDKDVLEKMDNQTVTAYIKQI